MDNITDSLRKRKRMEEDSFWFGYDPSEAVEEARRQGCQPFYEDVVGVPVTDPFQDYKPPDLRSSSCESLATKGFAAEDPGEEQAERCLSRQELRCYRRTKQLLEVLETAPTKDPLLQKHQDRLKNNFTDLVARIRKEPVARPRTNAQLRSDNADCTLALENYGR